MHKFQTVIKWRSYLLSSLGSTSFFKSKIVLESVVNQSTGSLENEFIDLDKNISSDYSFPLYFFLDPPVFEHLTWRSLEIKGSNEDMGLVKNSCDIQGNFIPDFSWLKKLNFYFLNTLHNGSFKSLVYKIVIFVKLP